MAVNQQALDALRALAQGGSSGYDQYQAARSSEQNSRTAALDSVLGGDAAKYVAEARTKYSPTVTGPSTDPGSLGSAYDSYVSEGAKKLADSMYESQQNLALSRAKMDAERAQASQPSDQERLQMLSGAATQMQETDRQKAAQDAATRAQDLAQGANPVVQGRGDILRSMAAIDTQLGPDAGWLEQHPEYAQGTQADLLNQKQALRGQLTQYDADARNRLAALAQLAGKDANGLNTEYQKFMDTGDAAGLQGLAQWVQGQGTPLIESEAQKRQREIDVAQNEYLRRLAPAFGIDPLRAAGMFPDFKGDPLQQVQDRQQRDMYVKGEVPAADRIKADKEQQALQDEQVASVLGFEDPVQVKNLRTKTKMSTDEIQGTMQSPDWAQISNIAASYYNGSGAYQDAGYPGFQKSVAEYLNTQGKYKPEDVIRFQDLVDAYWGSRVKSIAGSDRSMLQ